MQFKKPGIECADLMKVLGDETRLAVMRQLLYQPKQVNEINRSLTVSQSLLSHHLKILRDAGLVTSHRMGKAVLYEIAPSLRKTDTDTIIDMGCCQLSFRSDSRVAL